MQKHTLQNEPHMNAFDWWVETHLTLAIRIQKHISQRKKKKKRFSREDKRVWFPFGLAHRIGLLSKCVCGFVVLNQRQPISRMNSNLIRTIRFLIYAQQRDIFFRCARTLTTIMNPVLIYCNIIGVEQNGSFVIDIPRLAKTTVWYVQ